jgi:hemerythrin superfamily protein
MVSIANFFRGSDEKSQDQHNAIQMLKDDHRKVKSLVSEFESSKNGNRKLLLDNIIKELTVHTALEEELVYPIIAEADNEKAAKAIEEHHVVKLILGELIGIKTIDETVEMRVKVLWELVKDHIKEEEGDLFHKLKWSGEDMNALGERLAERKKKLMSSGERRGADKAPQPVRAKKASSSRRRKAGAGRSRKAS